MAADIEYRPVTAEELPAFLTTIGIAFGEDMREESITRERAVAEPERTIAGFDDDRIISTAGAFSFDLAVPGARLPAAGVTVVSVASTHRRRGILSRMMRDQLADVHERGEPIAALWASESSIYGRFGYGPASWRHRITVDRLDARLRSDLPVDDDIVLKPSSAENVLSIIETVEAALDSRPGTFQRSDGWRKHVTADDESSRRGMSSLQCVVAFRGPEPVGYVLYRFKSGTWRPHGLPDGEVLVEEQQAVDVAADAALTRHVLGLDLMRLVTWANLPAGSALPHLLMDPRQARTVVIDALHVRIVDLPAALARRRYAATLDVVLEVTDDLLPHNTGRWHLTGSPGGERTCVSTDAQPDLTMGIEAIGAIYLGGTPLTALAAAGRVRARSAEVLGQATTAFGWPLAPWCQNVF